MVEPVTTTVVVADVVCGVLGVALGAASVYADPGIGNTGEYVAALGVGRVCTAIPGGGVSFGVTYGAAKLTTNAVASWNQAASPIDPGNIEGVMKYCGIASEHYNEWHFFKDESTLKEDIQLSWKQDNLFKLGFAIQAVSGVVFFSMSHVSRDFLDVRQGVDEGARRNALTWVMMYYIPQPIKEGQAVKVESSPVFKTGT
jgi:hypothetical protein